MKQKNLENISSELGNILISKNLIFTCAESCTGGWVGHSITSVPGSSEWFGSSFVTYSYNAKENILGVNPKELDSFGAVSEEIVEQMVTGAINKTGANVGVAISGIAGPGGGSAERPVGTVCLAWKLNKDLEKQETFLFEGNRNEVRYQTVVKALEEAIVLMN